MVYSNTLSVQCILFHISNIWFQYGVIEWTVGFLFRNFLNSITIVMGSTHWLFRSEEDIFVHWWNFNTQSIANVSSFSGRKSQYLVIVICIIPHICIICFQNRIKRSIVCQLIFISETWKDKNKGLWILISSLFFVSEYNHYGIFFLFRVCHYPEWNKIMVDFMPNNCCFRIDFRHISFFKNNIRNENRWCIIGTFHNWSNKGT